MMYVDTILLKNIPLECMFCANPQGAHHMRWIVRQLIALVLNLKRIKLWRKQ